MIELLDFLTWCASVVLFGALAVLAVLAAYLVNRSIVEYFTGS